MIGGGYLVDMTKLDKPLRRTYETRYGLYGYQGQISLPELQEWINEDNIKCKWDRKWEIISKFNCTDEYRLWFRFESLDEALKFKLVWA
jgi:hypothetical protein